MTRPAPPSQQFDDGYLPGRILFSDGGRQDYAELSRHHYRPKPPSTWALVRVARYLDPTLGERLIGVAVLSYPVPMCRARMEHFGLPRSYAANLKFANAMLRTVSRVVVHPQFRSIGLAGELVRQLVERCPTRYLDSSARMGRYARFLEHAGFVRTFDGDAERPAYFVCDRTPEPSRVARLMSTNQETCP